MCSCWRWVSSIHCSILIIVLCVFSTGLFSVGLWSPFKIKAHQGKVSFPTQSGKFFLLKDSALILCALCASWPRTASTVSALSINHINLFDDRTGLVCYLGLQNQGQAIPKWIINWYCHIPYHSNSVQFNNVEMTIYDPFVVKCIYYWHAKGIQA